MDSFTYSEYIFLLVFFSCFFIFLGLSIFITYAISLWLGKLNNERSDYIKSHELTKEERKAFKLYYTKKKRLVCTLGIILNVGMLAYAKYTNFFAGAFFGIIGESFTAIDVIVPLGISFYTFTSTGYMIDVYREVCEAEKNPLKYALYVSFFPSILQGPITKYTQLSPQLYEGHAFDYSTVKSGLLRVLWGFFKKMVIADRIAVAVNTVFDNSRNYGGLFIAAAAVMYAVQLYADFSGYMDIAIGASETLGIKLTENFDTPYFSKNIAEFWRRWHISLGAWFRDYMYYPIVRAAGIQKLGKKIGKCLPKSFAKNIPTIIGLAITWTLIGFWHGSAWKYILYGVYYGAIIIFSTVMEPVYKKVISIFKIKTDCFSYSLFQILRTFAIVCFGYILFRASGAIAAFTMIENMFSAFNPWILVDGSLLTLGLSAADINVLIISVFVLFFVDLANSRGIVVRQKLGEQNIIFRWLAYFIGLFAVIIFGMYGVGYNPTDFIYFNF